MSEVIEPVRLTEQDYKQAAGRLFKPQKLAGYQPAALHLYRDAEGEIVYARVRMHQPNVSKPKEYDKLIRPFHWNGTDWKHGEPGFDGAKPLYGAHWLAAHPDALVIVAEGEQKADALTKIGQGRFVGITSGGATSAAGMEWACLAGREVRVWPDNDAPGHRYADEVSAALAAPGIEAGRIDIAELNLPPKGDVMDWIAAYKEIHGTEPSAADILALPLCIAPPEGLPIPDAGNNDAALADRREWPLIRPLPEKALASVQAFDMALLPQKLQPWAEDIADRMQCPPDFIGATIMAALGVVIGRRVGVRPKAKDDWTEYANVWLCIIGRPAVMKSPSMAAALKPLYTLQTKAQDQFDSAHAEYLQEMELYEMRVDADRQRIKTALKKDAAAAVQQTPLPEPVEPVLRRYLVIDTSAESLLDTCIENPQGVGVFRDELVSLLKSMDREGQEAARGFYLTGWNGNDGYTVDRIGRGRNHRAEAVCLSMMGSTQPGRIAEYLREAISDGAGNDGLMQRFGLLIWPDISADWQDVDRWPDTDKKCAAFGVFEALAEANPVTDWQAEIVIDHTGQPVRGAPPYLRLNDDALALFRDWRQEWETGLRSGNLHPALESHFAKYRKLVPSLALICHVADGGSGPVSVEAMTRALAWADYLRTHAERAYGTGIVTPVDRARALLRKILDGKLPLVPFPLKQVYRAQWSMLTTQEEAAEAVAVLVDHGYVIEEAAGDEHAVKGGRPREPRYIVNLEVQK